MNHSTHSQSHRHAQSHAEVRHPKLDLQALLERFKLPGINADALIESRRKDIEALLAANERVFNGIEALSQKQIELLADVMKEWQESAKEAVAKSSGTDKVNQAVAHAQHAFSHALANMKDMADIAAKSHEDVLAILTKRYRDGVEEFRNSLQKRSAK